MTLLSPAVQGSAMVRPSRRSHTPGTKPEWNRDLARGDGTWRFTHRREFHLRRKPAVGDTKAMQVTDRKRIWRLSTKPVDNVVHERAGAGVSCGFTRHARGLAKKAPCHGRLFESMTCP